MTLNVDRKLIFISHANPEDNEFTLWLASRLTAMGYLVWSDVTKLFGAELFWEDIEDAIRNHAVKVIAVLTRTAQQKSGVLDEVNLAVSVERTQKYERFVIPIRIDDLSFSDVKPNLARKAVIDFKEGWTDGFQKLLKVLERDKVRKDQAPAADEMSKWLENLVAGSERVVAEPQPVLSNWFSYKLLPEALHFFRVPIPASDILTRFESFPYPVYSYRDMIATFASIEDLDSYLPSWQSATHAHSVPLAEIIKSESHSLPELHWQDATRMLSYLIRTSWDKAMLAKGLRPYEMASGKKAWYPPVGYSPEGYTKYADMDGVIRKKHLVGRSDKRRVHWHFAMELWPSMGRELHLVLKPHVVFSEDGRTPLSSAAKMHRLRRSFCRSWWNARWRDLMLAYTTHVTDESGGITVPVGVGTAIIINPRPIYFNAPVSLSVKHFAPIGEDETDSQLDEMAEDIDFSTEDDEEEVEDKVGTDISTGEEKIT